MQPCRNCLDKVFGHVPVKVKQIADESDEDVEPESEVGPVQMSLVKHTGLTALIVASGFTIAYFVDDLRVGKLLRVLSDTLLI